MAGCHACPVALLVPAPLAALYLNAAIEGCQSFEYKVFPTCQSISSGKRESHTSIAAVSQLSAAPAVPDAKCGRRGHGRHFSIRTSIDLLSV